MYDETHQRHESAVDRSAAREALGGVASREIELPGKSVQNSDPSMEVWEHLAKTHSKDQMAMLRKLSKKGPGAFKRGKSAEAAPAGPLLSDITRFRPTR